MSLKRSAPIHAAPSQLKAPTWAIAIGFGGTTNIIEIKLVHPADGREATLREGLEQIARYADATGADTRHLVIFDRRPEYRAKPWEERLGWESHTTPAGHPVAVVWC